MARIQFLILFNPGGFAGWFADIRLASVYTAYSFKVTLYMQNAIYILGTVNLTFIKIY